MASLISTGLKTVLQSPFQISLLDMIKTSNSNFSSSRRWIGLWERRRTRFANFEVRFLHLHLIDIKTIKTMHSDLLMKMKMRRLWSCSSSLYDYHIMRLTMIKSKWSLSWWKIKLAKMKLKNTSHTSSSMACNGYEISMGLNHNHEDDWKDKEIQQDFSCWCEKILIQVFQS